MRNPKRKDGVASLTTANATQETLRVLVLSIFLAATVFAVFGSTLNDQFLNYDDNDYVYDNPKITNGLSLDGIGWAFTHFHADNWHPLTTISHMLDCQLYGVHPWGHHLTNILLHAAAAIVLFLALLKLTVGEAVGFPRDANSIPYRLSEETRRQSAVATLAASPAVIDRRYNFWASAFVAALFAIHPLRVESVAWISERKDVLSGVSFMLTLWAYGRYAREDRHRVRNYVLVIVCFILGLLCKPSLVTLPFVLLLLDYWPLGRWQGAGSRELGAKSKAESGKGEAVAASTSQPLNISTSVRGLVLEKAPLFLLSAASCVVTVIAQKSAFAAIEHVPFQLRFANAVVSYVVYLWQTIWPVNLTALYPYPEHSFSGITLILALVLLWGVSIAFYLCRREYPFLLIGWLWFVGTLVPMIGLVQVGSQSRADRYTYLAAIGLYIAATWGAIEVSKKWTSVSPIVKSLGVIIVISLAARSYFQTFYWHDSEALWQHAIDVTPRNHIAHNSLANTLLEKSELERAIIHYRESLAIKPNVAPVQSNLGNALLRKGEVDEAIAQFQQAIHDDPGYAEADNDMGSALIKKGQFSEAISYYEKAVALKTNYADAHNNLGVALFETGQIDSAIGEYRKAIAIKPQSAEVQCNLGNALARKNDWTQAIAAYRNALRARPDYAKARNNLGVALEQIGNTDEAFAQFRESVERNPNYAEAHYNLGRILARRGQKDEAIAQLTEALRLQPNYPEATRQLLNLGVAK